MDERQNNYNTSDSRDIKQGADEYYAFASSLSSKENELVLNDIKKRVESAATWMPDNYSILAFPYSSEDFGLTLPFHGIINVHPKMLTPQFQKIALAVAAHERVHLHIGGVFRRNVFTNAPSIDTHFHGVILPLWRSGTISLPQHDQEFIDSKKWRSIYEEWDGSRIEFDHIVKSLKHYYWLLERGYLRTDKDGYLDDPLNPEDSINMQILTKQNPMSIQQQFQENPQQYLKSVITGYELGDYLLRAYRNQVAHDHKTGLWENEENLANFVGIKIANISIEELKATTTQDEGKFYLIDKFKDKFQDNINELLALTTNYQHFATVLKSL
jgi:hypothetical protein